MTKSIVNWFQEFVGEVERLSVDDPARDGDYLRPEELRGLLRLMYYLLSDLQEHSGGNHDKPEA